MRRRYEVTKILASVFAFFFVLVLSIGYGLADEKPVSPSQVSSIKQWDNVKEYTADIDIRQYRSGLIWCGNKEIAFLTQKKRKISMFVFYKHDLSVFKEEILNSELNLARIHVPICSNDGQYVFFRYLKEGGFIDLRYYERNSKSIRTVLSSKNAPSSHTDELISPMHNYLIGPSGWVKQIHLPGVSNVKVIPFDAIVSKEPLSEKKIVWDPFDRRVYFLDISSQILSIVDPKTLQRKNIEVKINGYKVSDVKATSNPDKLFLMAISKDDIDQNAYLLDLSNKKKPITLFLSKIDSFEVSPSGIYVYSKTYGVKRFGGGNITYAHEASKRYISINVIDDNRNEKVIKKIYFGAGANSWYALSTNPIISQDGHSLLFTSIGRDENGIEKIHVIQSK